MHHKIGRNTLHMMYLVTICLLAIGATAVFVTFGSDWFWCSGAIAIIAVSFAAWCGFQSLTRRARFLAFSSITGMELLFFLLTLTAVLPSEQGGTYAMLPTAFVFLLWTAWTGYDYWSEQQSNQYKAAGRKRDAERQARGAEWRASLTPPLVSTIPVAPEDRRHR